jgi:uncharacterized membrane protein
MVTDSISGSPLLRSPVATVSVDAPTQWLNAGWRDFRRAPWLSLGYGGSIALSGYVIVFGLNALGLGSLMPVAVAAFFLLAPLLAIGLYQVSKRIEAGEKPDLRSCFAAIRQNASGQATMGLILMLSMAAWTQVALLVFMLFFHAEPPPLENFVLGILTAPEALPFLAVGTAAGAVIAAIVFAISAVSIPMLLDRNVSAGTAIATSIGAVQGNRRVMIGWAATIVLLVGIGIATMFIGLAVILPVLAYATWHAYRDLVV